MYVLTKPTASRPAFFFFCKHTNKILIVTVILIVPVVRVTITITVISVMVVKMYARNWVVIRHISLLQVVSCGLATMLPLPCRQDTAPPGGRM